jgi:hypothetical protein
VGAVIPTFGGVVSAVEPDELEPDEVEPDEVEPDEVGPDVVVEPDEVEPDPVVELDEVAPDAAADPVSTMVTSTSSLEVKAPSLAVSRRR